MGVPGAAQGQGRGRRRRPGCPLRRRAAACLWSRVFSADDLRSMRHLKARTEAELARKGLTDREVKRGRGGIRDIEFAVQLLQLVHGRLDPDLRCPNTLAALTELAAVGLCRPRRRRAARRRLPVPPPARALSSSSTTARRSTPCRRTNAERIRIARTLGFRDTGRGERPRAARRRARPPPGHRPRRSTNGSTSGRSSRPSPAATRSCWPGQAPSRRASAPSASRTASAPGPRSAS